jgi:hypothetical protein
VIGASGLLIGADIAPAMLESARRGPGAGGGNLLAAMTDRGHAQVARSVPLKKGLDDAMIALYQCRGSINSADVLWIGVE